jgi:hypothetical protein
MRKSPEPASPRSLRIERRSLQIHWRRFRRDGPSPVDLFDELSGEMEATQKEDSQRASYAERYEMIGRS